MILTPEGEVLYLATYIPLHDDFEVEGLMKLLPRLAALYKEDHESAKKIVESNKRLIDKNEIAQEATPDGNISMQYVKKMQSRYDAIYKGFDKRPRFPLASHLNLLLQIHLLHDNKEAYEMVQSSLKAMAHGGIYDQIEGGFFRYATDQDWVVPHFEKMLYTNAELIPLYTQISLLTHEDIYQKIVKETIETFKSRYMQDQLFFSASDADSMGEEGRYFVYGVEEVQKRMMQEGYTKNEIEENLDYYDISLSGNFKDGYSNVHFNTEIENRPMRFEETMALLRVMRHQRTYPFIDKKIITSWNSMMIKALFIASKLDPSYQKQAEASLAALLKRVYIRGALYHQAIGTHAPSVKALLEDYAFLIDALLVGYQRNFKDVYLKLAQKLTRETVEKFYRNGKWYLDEGDFGARVPYDDRHYTSAMARHFNNLLTLAHLNYDLKLLQDTKKYIADETSRILNAFDKSPEALLALLRLKQGDIVLKSSHERLLNSYQQIDKITYPFLLKKSEETEMFLLCDMQSCFFYDKNLTKVIEKIK